MIPQPTDCNHLSTERMRRTMKTDVFIWHGYTELWLVDADVRRETAEVFRYGADRHRCAMVGRKAATTALSGGDMRDSVTIKLVGNSVGSSVPCLSSHMESLMAKTVEQIRQQIQKLQQEEQALMAKEVAGVVDRIKEAIAYYNLTPEQLFGRASTRGLAARLKRKSVSKVKVLPEAKVSARPRSNLKGSRIAIKYRDDQGNAWTGRGSQPRWLRSALEAGKTLEDFSI